MWILGIYLPLIVGDMIPTEDNLWECYLLLLDIVQVCMYDVYRKDAYVKLFLLTLIYQVCTSRIVSPALAGYLEALIDQHHQSFRHCYPGVELTPKHHYMVHFPALLLKYVSWYYLIWQLAHQCHTIM